MQAILGLCGVAAVLSVAGARGIGDAGGGSSMHFDVQIGQRGNFEVFIDNELWFQSTSTGVYVDNDWYSASNGKLSFIETVKWNGVDNLGSFTATCALWNAGATPFNTCIRQYPSRPNTVVFEQLFPKGANGTDIGDPDLVSSHFPSLSTNSSQSLGFTQWYGEFIWINQFGRWSPDAWVFGGKQSGPIAIFDETAARTVVVSPYSNFMAASHLYSDATEGGVAWGILGSIQHYPPNYSLQVVLHAHAGGINSAMEEWGSLLLTTYNKPSDGPAFDYTVQYLGYNTDHGAYYYYNTEEGKNYQETLLDVYNYSQSINVPYRVILLDSWWYYKGLRDGVKNWTAMHDVFPDGNEGILELRQATGWHIIAHNRYWSANTDYAKQNGGNWDFIVEANTTELAIPTQQEFWVWLLSESRKWGLSVYEQDWLYNEFEWMNATLADPALARDWLLQMGHGAAEAGVNIQYCMPYPRHALQSVELPAVTQIRVSDDYVPGGVIGTSQWKIGVSSLLAHAIGLAPFKDSFWTSTTEPNNEYDATEPYPERQSAVSTLSCGPVMPSDGIGMTNAALVKRSCDDDGKLLQPSKPATAVDSLFLRRAFSNESVLEEVWATYSNVSGFVWAHVFVADVMNPWVIPASDIGISSTGVAYRVPYKPWNETAVAVNLYSPSQGLKIEAVGEGGMDLWHITSALPGSNGWVLLGELSKWVPMSPDRFTAVTVAPGVVECIVRGSPGETITVYAAHMATKELRSASATLGPAGEAVVAIRIGNAA